MVSIQHFTEIHLGSNPHRPSRRMNIYTFDIFPNRWTAVEKIYEPNKYRYRFHHLEIGPFNLPEPLHLAAVKEAIWNNSSHLISSKRWTDFYELLRAGTTLSMQLVVEELNIRFDNIESATCKIHNISKNLDISMSLHEKFPTVMKRYRIMAKRKRLHTLKQIAAFNVAKCISRKDDVLRLEMLKSYQLVAVFLDTYSGDFMNV